MSAVLIIAGIVAAALILVGLWGLLDPHRMSNAYGLPADGSHAHGMTRAAAIRDLVIGGILGMAVYLHSVPFIAVLGVAGILLSSADFLIAFFANHRRLHRSHANHAAGIVAFVLVAAMALWAIAI
jgi:hypothetical protein